MRLLLQSLDDYGPQAFSLAVQNALDNDTPHANAVAQILQCDREQQLKPPPVPLSIDHPQAHLQMPTASLDPYQSLTQTKKEDTHEDHRITQPVPTSGETA